MRCRWADVLGHDPSRCRTCQAGSVPLRAIAAEEARARWAAIVKLLAGAPSWRVVGSNGAIQHVFVKAKPPAMDISIVVDAPINLGGTWR
jgi:hypothetical protein